MQSETTKCVKCGGEMSAGFILNVGIRKAIGSAPSVGVSGWQEGDSGPSFWTEMKHFGKAEHPITAYRCKACGYLESYAK